MSRLGYTLLVILLAVESLACSLMAQTSSGEQISASARRPEGIAMMSKDNPDISLKGREEGVQYASSLDGTGLIPMDSTATTHILLGATASGAWDSNPDNLGAGVSSGAYILSPYLGLQINTIRTQYLLQYQPTITGYTASAYSNRAMNIGSVTAIRNVNDRWKWDLRAAGSYGQDTIRLLAPQQTVVVGEIAGIGPNAASYLPNAGTVTYIDGTLGANYKRSERDSLQIRAGNSFTHYTGLSKNNSIATTNISYDHALSPVLGSFIYEQNSYYYGTIHCASLGGGVGLKWQARERTALSLSGGPQFNTSSCGGKQNFSFSTAFSTRLSEKSQIYLLAARQPTASYLGPGLWQMSASGGYQRQVTAIGTVSVDVGYVGSDTLTTTSSYQGLYFSCIYRYYLNRGFNISYSYRGYVGNSGGISNTRNVALFSVSWTPGAGRIFQR